MGVCGSKGSTEPPKQEEAPSGRIVDPFAERRAKARQEAEAKAAAEGKPVQQLDSKDYEFRDLVAETRVKLPGSVNGQSFTIDNCQDCHLYILDNTAQVLIDECRGCTIYVGPCASSVFFRDCSDCNFIVACQQLRTRSSKRIKLMLFCGTRPTIETTTEIEFSCFQFSYFSLMEQFNKTNMSVWNNKWSQVYDFNHAKGLHHQINNFASLDELVDWDKFAAGLSGVDIEEFKMESPVPLTTGPSNSSDPREFAIAFGEESASNFYTSLLKIDGSVKNSLVRTCKCKLDADNMKILFQGDKAAATAAQKQSILVGFEFLSSEAMKKALSAVITEGGGTIWQSAKASDQLGVFFEQLQPSDQF